MPTFNYEAITNAGNPTAGTLEAATRPELISRLQSMGLYPTKVSEAGAEERGFGISFLAGRVKGKDVEFFSYQMATLLNSAVSLAEALDITMRQVSNPQMQRVIERVKSDVEHGTFFADALAQHPKAFNDLYVNMIRAGEEGGVLGVVMERLADFSERLRVLKQNVTSALFYPAILIVLSILAITVLTIFVIPKFTVLFEDLNVTLPLPTRILLVVIDFVSSWRGAVFFVGIIAAIIGAWQYSKTESGKLIFDGVKLKVPIIGPVFQIFALSRFTRTMGTLLENAVELLPALRVVKDTIGNQVYRNAVEESEKAIERGSDLSTPLEESGVFPAMITHMISIGEASAQLNQMFSKLADYYDMEIKKHLDRLMTILSPIIILVMGLMIGFIAVAMVLPIFQASSLIGGG